MWKRMGIPLIAAAATLTLGAGTALAVELGTASGQPVTSAKTWTVEPGGNVSGTSNRLVASDSTSKISLSCKSGKTNGVSKSGSGLNGVAIMVVSSGTNQQCTAPNGDAFTIVNTGFPWAMNAVSYDASTGVTHFTINGIKATTTGPGCAVQVGGTKPGTGGEVHATYSNTTQKLTLLAKGSNLHLWGVKGCDGLMKDGDSSTFTGAFSMSPTQNITSP